MFPYCLLYSCRGGAVNGYFGYSDKNHHTKIMAKIKFGAIVSDVRGSIDSVTYARSRYGSYARKKVTPVNPNTAKQSVIRALFGAASAAFRSLGTSTIKAWNDIAPEYSRSNIFGDNLPLSGQTLFTKLKTQLSAAGIATNPSPIAPVTIPAIHFYEVVADVSEGTMLVKDTTATGANQVLVIRASAPVSAGRSFFSRSQMRTIWVVPSSTAAAELDILDQYATVFGTPLSAPNVGLKFRVEMFLVDTRNGQAGVASSFDCAIIA